MVRAGQRAAGSVADATLMARPGGGFAVCFGDDGRGRTAVLGCSFTDARGTFGPMQVIERRSWRQRPRIQAEMRADGTVAAVVMYRRDGGRQKLRSTTLDARGMRGPLRSLATIGRLSTFSLATTDDGSTAVAWATPPTRDPRGPWVTALRSTPPFGDEFGPSLPFLPRGPSDRGASAVRLQGGREFRVFVSGDPNDPSGDVIVRRLADGSFSAPLRFPRPASGGRLSGPVVTLADGSPLAIVASSRSTDTDCANLNLGVIGSGPLVSAAPLPNQDPAVPTPESVAPPTPGVQRLSAPGQLATDPIAATLADGTAVASWRNVRDVRGRLEVAIRPANASAFRPSQVLPKLAARESVLAAGGSRAVLAWVVGDLPDGPSHVVASSLRNAPPYAARAPLPKRRQANCG